MPVGDGARRESGPAASAPFARDLAWFSALFVATLWGSLWTMGVSPTVWEDTLIEDQFIDRCLLHDQCSIVGPAATIGIYHSAGYLHWRALLTWIGFDATATHLTLLVMSALGVASAALVARRIAGRTAAAIAALVMVASVGVPTQLNVITDVAPLPFLGAVFLLVAEWAFRRQRLVNTAVLGLVGAVVANTYATGLTCGVSAVWLALVMPRRRWAHAAVAAGSFALATFAIAPGTWILDAYIVLSRSLGNASHVVSNSLLGIRMVSLAAVVTAAWAVAAARRLPLRAALEVPASIIVPLFVPLVLASAIGRLHPQAKYCSQIAAAISVGVAVAVVALLRVLQRPATTPLRRAVAWLPTLAATDRLGPYLAAGAIALLSTLSGLRSSVEPPPVTARELLLVDSTLAHGHGWTRAKAARDLRALDDMVTRAAVRNRFVWPGSGDDGDLERAYFIKRWSDVDAGPLPGNVVPLSSTATDVSLLVFTCSWIDWRSFRACVSRPGVPAETCTETGLVAPGDTDLSIPGMPVVDPILLARQTLTLHIPLSPRPDCTEESIYMPRLRRVCPGRIVSVEGVSAEVDPSGRSARMKLAAGTEGQGPRELVLQWELGGPDCLTEYRGIPPFFVEGDPRSVEFLRPVLEDGRP